MHTPKDLSLERAVLGARHRCSGLNSRFRGGGMTFEDYAADCREMITRAHAGMDDALLQKVIAGNAPFELEPAQGGLRRRGILLLHGLTDSPYFMRHLGEFFRRQGFHVATVLLPGHGTQPGDLLEVTWRDWLDAVRYGVAQLAERNDEIHLGGFSTGGALGLLHSLHDERVRSLFLFSPALGITRRAACANWHKPYSWLFPKARWAGIMPDSDIYKYESFARNAAAQVYALTREIGRRLRQRTMDVPVFIAASLEDVTVDAAATVAFMARARHPGSRMVLYASGTPHELDGMPAGRVEWVNSAVPAQKILGSAHTGIVLPPEDAHYGAVGDYANCLHYYPDDIGKYTACLAPSAEINLGEITADNLKSGLLRRLMYNPHYAALEASMGRFIASV